MIPKTIHYIWLSGEAKPPVIQRCLDSWNRILVPKNWEIRCWTIDDIPHNTWVDEAIAKHKWALASDYLRLYVLHKYGGVYLDSDVFVRKDFTDLLNCEFFVPIEYNAVKFRRSQSACLLTPEGYRINNESGVTLIQGLTAQAAIIGATKGNPLLRDMMQYYETAHFVLGDGSYNYSFLAPDLVATKLEKYGFRYIDETYDLVDHDGIIWGKVYATSYFASGISSATSSCYGIHVYTSAWQDLTFYERALHKLKLAVKAALLLK